MRNLIAVLVYLFPLLAGNNYLLGKGTNEGKTIVIVDQNLPFVNVLFKNVQPGIQMVYLDQSDDPVTAIDKIIRENAPISALHIFTHGKPGAMLFSFGKLDIGIAEQNVQVLASWKQYFVNGGDMLLYGCNLARGNKGTEFINVLSSITGLDVAASDDLTGSSLKGGDWKLEQAIGEIESASILRSSIKEYPAVFKRGRSL